MIKRRFMDGRLYDLLPSVVRHRDSLTGEPLKTKLSEFGDQVDLVENKISAAYANFFVETCDREELAQIADLIGYRPIISDPSGADVSALRRDIAKTIWARRRKGTAEVLGAIVRLLTDWHTVVFENNGLVVSTPSVRFAAAARSQGTPDIRKLVGRDQIDQRPGLVPRVATVRRVDACNARGRWHPFDVVVEAWSSRATMIQEPLGTSPDGRYLTLGNDRPLFAPADASAHTGETLRSARAIRLTDFTGPGADELQATLYGKDKAVCLLQRAIPRGGSGNPGELISVEVDFVRFGRVPMNTNGKQWIIDPERGRIQRPKGNAGPVLLRHYAAAAEKIEATLTHRMTERLAEHAPMEARTGVVRRSL